MTPEQKLEKFERVKELKPAETLRRIGLAPEAAFADIGAGTGLFTLAAAALTRGTVYALEIDPELLDIIARKADAAGADNVRCSRVTDEGFALPQGAVDVALLCTVLHNPGIPDKVRFLSDVAALLKPGGRLAVIEFHKRETPMGPGVEKRLGPDAVDALTSAAAFSPADAFDLGDNFYCAVYRK